MFFKAIAEGELFPYSLDGPVHGAVDAPLHLATQVTGAPEALPYATAVVLLGAVLLVNATAIALRVYLRSRKKW